MPQRGSGIVKGKKEKRDKKEIKGTGTISNFRKQILLKSLKQYKGTPDSSGLFIRQAQS